MKAKTKILKLLIVALTIVSCDNDDGNAPNMTGCNFQGLSVEDNSGTTVTLIAESDLQTDYFPNNNGPGLAAVEVFATSTAGTTLIVTDALTVGAVDNNPQIMIEGVTYTGTITCQLANDMVGEELRFDIAFLGGSIEGELCVIIDDVTP